MSSAWNLPPEEIERRSFAIIDEEAPEHQWPPDAWSLIRRMVHTSADFDYVTTVRMHPLALTRGAEALQNGRNIYTDTNMVRSGISKARLPPFNVSVECLIDAAETREHARQNGTTRAVAAVDLALPGLDGGLYVIGNAPTALFRLIEHVRAGRVVPALIIGLPVGFVNAAESKDALLELDIPFITAVGRKGGSNVAAAVVNALTVLAREPASPRA